MPSSQQKQNTAVQSVRYDRPEGRFGEQNDDEMGVAPHVTCHPQHQSTPQRLSRKRVAPKKNRVHARSFIAQEWFSDEVQIQGTQPSRGTPRFTEDISEQSRTEQSQSVSQCSSRIDRLVEEGDWEGIVFAASHNHETVGPHLFL